MFFGGKYFIVLSIECLGGIDSMGSGYVKGKRIFILVLKRIVFIELEVK